MQKNIIYTYLGENGIIFSPVHLDNVYSVKRFQLTADPDNILHNKKNNEYRYQITISQNELPDWEEIPEADKTYL